LKKLFIRMVAMARAGAVAQTTSHRAPWPECSLFPTLKKAIQRQEAISEQLFGLTHKLQSPRRCGKQKKFRGYATLKCLLQAFRQAD